MGVAVHPPIMHSSAASALLQLDESEVTLQSHALHMLDKLADSFWPEISPFVVKIQELSENDSFPEAKLAAVVAAKVLFHLGDLDEALIYALRSGEYFNVSADTEFAITLRAKCIDEYVNLQLKESMEDGSTDVEKKEALKSVIERVLENCIERGEIREALGVAIEARRLDRVRSAVKSCSSRAERIAALSYCFECAQTLVASRQYRNDILKLLAELHREEDQPEEVATANCLSFVEDAQGLADTLKKLVASGDKTRELIALQIAFDIYDNDTSRFSEEVSALFPADVGSTGGENPESKHQREILTTLRKILSGRTPSALTLDFLSNYSKSDAFILEKIKQLLETRITVCHTALIFTNAIMHAGTAIDGFLRENLDWLARATSWAKFSATACLGVIHARHTASALNLLAPYLSTHSNSTSAYSEGGALYALGLMFAHGDSQDPARDAQSANRDGSSTGSTSESIDAKQYLLTALRNAQNNEVVQHGACLGLGLAAMGSWDGNEEGEIYDELKQTLFTDNAVAGEAAGIGMGLVCIGSGSEKALEVMFQYAQETEHEKIIRGLAMGMALICYGREDEAEDIINKMSDSKEPILRYGAMYAVAMAYAGTADNKAIRHLLHMAVSDVSDDVRRAAVIALGFVLFRHPKQVPKIIDLSADSCFPHVRYGAAMALGIACAGTGLASAAEILEKLAKDNSDFVRQGALIALSMVYMQHTEAMSPKSAEVRKLFDKTIGEKHEDVMAKFGAILATGIIDAGGRNSTIGLTSRSGHRRMSAVVGLALFTQYWYWFPMVHFIGLSFRPSALIAVNENMKLPNLNVKCSAKPSLFKYPPRIAQERRRTEARAPAAVLSVTAKALARESRKEKKKASTAAAGSSTQKDDMDVDSGEAKEDGAASANPGDSQTPKEKNEEPNSFMLVNPCRVLEEQEKYISWPSDGRYQPVKSSSSNGFVVLHNTRPDEEEDLVELRSFANAQPAPVPAAAGSNVNNSARASSLTTDTQIEDEGPEPEPPEPFDFIEE
mmetsp:Transcript_3610/g.10844  ORF Transcript_3610/g.10844 Transcript_3610/m.10844 type:complete len:1016 (+) Transcript_3610:101-3148(+)|eukprot:CAMPEP_0198735628 /NCGR_PEP_ID=MMETSP1475-20131203/61033_1 /TAXON_ID= ORGANISM="Unidentified sp., Strain CCMP1999" /NCGR_SAMPLE_ID=MMETSP1475 /ASSEMBLY_ACC=CAM_ASM_001111 /LENGTH=1015 /DNA_ID=CAMNT_0044499319 /DNA_START=51 /DNA_END=3098 /DNA_ORIENTATION=-